jgi:hypothetical protein
VDLAELRGWAGEGGEDRVGEVEAGGGARRRSRFGRQTHKLPAPPGRDIAGAGSAKGYVRGRNGLILVINGLWGV